MNLSYKYCLLQIEAVYPSPQLKVQLSTSSFLTLKPDAVDAVRIEISSLVPGETNDQDRIVIIYRAWMFRTTQKQSSDAPDMEWFPVMLYAGKD